MIFKVSINRKEITEMGASTRHKPDTNLISSALHSHEPTIIHAAPASTQRLPKKKESCTEVIVCPESKFTLHLAF
jgi:hypothetical protein